LPAFADDTGVPPFLLDLPLLRSGLLALAVAAAIVVAVAAGGLALVRQASPSRLREVQQ
jgi:hypothetical protein